MSKIYPCIEENLTELESILPELMGSHQSSIFTTRQKVVWRRIQEILKGIRWNDGPHTVYKYNGENLEGSN